MVRHNSDSENDHFHCSFVRGYFLPVLIHVGARLKSIVKDSHIFSTKNDSVFVSFFVEKM